MIISLMVGMSLAVPAFAGDSFPAFSEAPLELKVPIEMRGYQPTPKFVTGTNAVYAFSGQIFTNAASGHIQTASEGSSGETDKSTPWKTLTELLAVYQRGSDEKSLRSLYTTSSQSFLDHVYGNPKTAARMKAYGASISGMQAVLGLNFDKGFVAFVTANKTDGKRQAMSFYFVKSNRGYLLSTFDNSDKRIQNLEVFFNTHSAAELLR